MTKMTDFVRPQALNIFLIYKCVQVTLKRVWLLELKGIETGVGFRLELILQETLT